MTRLVRLTRLIVAALFTFAVATTPTAAKAAESDEIRKTLFAEASGALKAANSARASLLAPIGYSEASEFYRKAEDLLEDGSSLEAIRRNLRKAADTFNSATKAADRASREFSGVLTARAAAADAKAETYACLLYTSPSPRD